MNSSDKQEIVNYRLQKAKETLNRRQIGDYDDFVDYSEEDVSDIIEPAKNLIAVIEKQLKR